MTLVDLLALYLLFGLACGIAVLVRQRRHDMSTLSSAALTVVLWPLWGPVALTHARPSDNTYPRTPAESQAYASRHPISSFERSILECADIADGTTFAELLSAAKARQIADAVRGLRLRISDLEAVVDTPEFDTQRIQRDLERLRMDHPGRNAAIRTVESQLECAEEIHRVLAEDRQRMEDLGRLALSLRARLIAERLTQREADALHDTYSDPHSASVASVISEIWSRLENSGKVAGDAKAS